MCPYDYKQYATNKLTFNKQYICDNINYYQKTAEKLLKHQHLESHFKSQSK